MSPAPRSSRIPAIRSVLYIAGLLGLALLTWLIVDAGAGDVADAMLVIGWGLVPVTLFHLVPLFTSTLSWRDMLPAAGRPGLAVLVWVRWVRESINNLLPVGQVGGDLVGARLMHQRGMAGAPALASVVVDLTVGLLTQMAFLALGLIVLLLHSTSPAVLTVVWGVLIGMGIFVGCIVIFFAAQQRGMMAFIAKVAGNVMKAGAAARLVDSAADVDAAIRRVYRDPRIWRATGVRLATWLIGTGEIWLIMYFLGKPVSLGEAMVLEAFITSVRSAAFLIPGAVGVQEGAAVIFGGVFGITPADALALSLGKRVRELLLGVPGLISWQVSEGRRLIGERR